MTALIARSTSHVSDPHDASGKPGELPIDIPEEFVADILRPYRRNVKYLKCAQITHLRDSERPAKGVPILTATGRFSIPESCYIDATGHFNDVRQML